MAENAHNQPDFVCNARQKMARQWTIVRDVADGTLRLREVGAQYLPAEKAEKSEAYAIRLSRAILFNALDRTLHSLVGMVFRKPPTLNSDVPDVMRGRAASDDVAGMEGLLEDADLAGNHWTVVAKELFTDAMRDGHAFLMVDAPPYPKRDDGQPATLQDLERERWRPYLVRYRADQAINWRTDSKGRLLQITFEEKTWEADGEFGEQEVCRYRVLRPGSWQVWRKIKDPKGETETLVLDTLPNGQPARGITPLTEIPVAVVYSRRTGPLTSRPPLLDLALVNIAHWQKYSDYSIGLHLTIPILGLKGGNADQKVQAIGHYVVFRIPPDGDLKYVEPTGAGLEPQRTDLIDLEDKMAVLGAAMLSKRTPTPKTATEELLSHVKEESDLATAARSLQDCLELALSFFAKYLRLSSGGSVTLGATVEELTLSPEKVRAFGELVTLRVVSKQTVREILGQANELPDDFDEQRELQRLDREAADEEVRQQNLGAAALAAFDRGQ
ncbi:MAG: DUF4055 domain-containing protein [Acidobacteria bacterium]|nr:DUF4055 domain-containing protein [Acidobacteriota bacterium]